MASLTLKARIGRVIGPAIDRWSRLAYNFIAMVTILPILLLPLLLSDRKIYVIPFPWVILTLAVQLLAIIALLAGLRQTGIFSFLGINQAFIPEDISPPHLVIDGLYRYVRHPLYTAGLVIIWLLPVLTWNLLAMNFGLTVYILIGATIEERKLLRKFGEAYAKYRSRTPMLIPELVFHASGDKS
jgi:protein-S-isoprenylcysteine O-methyltransferase Ste14